MTNEDKFCKYCLEDTDENSQDLIYPCQCSDGIHADCLAIWIAVRPHENRYRCEICNTNYIGIYIPPPSPPPHPPPPPFELSISDDPVQIEHRLPREFVFCHCNMFEGCFYLTSGVLFFSSVVMGGVQPSRADRKEYYHIMIMIMLVACFFFALSLIFTARRYFDRLQALRTINTVPNGE